VPRRYRRVDSLDHPIAPDPVTYPMNSPSPPSYPVLTEQQVKDAIEGPPDVEWRYEMRRQCQEIVPNLLLGPFLVSKSLETLQSLGVTHILCIRDVKEAFSVRARFPSQFVYLELDVRDNEEQNLIRVYPKARDFILAALFAGGKVLVHCNGGISLSPAFVIMFVMEQYGMTSEQAIQLVQNKRYCISPNGGFMTQIKEYEPIYRAKKALSTGIQPDRNVRRKRSDEDDEEAEEVLKRRRPRDSLEERETQNENVEMS